MSRRRGAAVVLGVSCLLATAGCGGGSGGAHADSFTPGGPASSGPAVAASPSPSANNGGFAFPSSVQLNFDTPLPAKGVRRAVVAGYQEYVRSFWYAIYTNGRSHAYASHLQGNALTFLHQTIQYNIKHHLTISGTARYFDTSVRQVFSGRGAELISCVDVSGFHDVSAKTGKRVGDVFPRRFMHYEEDVALGRLQGGGWFVSHTENFPASESRAAQCQ
ncbi:MAG TPA: hypothetical protein VGI64_22630 [Streptosporangiaceae bacterium]